MEIKIEGIGKRIIKHFKIIIMYENGSKEESVNDKHVKLAKEMSGAICDFMPEHQNEMVKIIYDTVYENRQARIDEAEKAFIHLKDTLIQLQGNEKRPKAN